MAAQNFNMIWENKKSLGKSGIKLIKKIDKKRKDWKSKVSGAFEIERIFLSLVVLVFFYLGYALEGSITNST